MNEVQIVGESCVDVYIYGRCPRLSPEAPVPVFVQERIERVPGMAGNVVANLRALGVTGPFLTQEQVITKTRYVEETRNHPLLRVDDDPPVSGFDWIIDPLTPLVLVDYNKGFLKAEDMEKASLPPLSFMDTKKPLGSWCRGITFIKINEHEYKASEAFIQANPWMDERLIVTLGHQGACYMGKLYPVKEAQVFDVTGAGDTFFAGFIASYLKSKDVAHAIMVANECARRVVMQRGTSVVSAEMRELL